MMISSSAIDTATQFCMTEAASASPIHTAEVNQILSMPHPPWRTARDRLTGGAARENGTRMREGIPPACGRDSPPRHLTRQESSAQGTTAGAVKGGLHPQRRRQDAAA